MNTKQSTQLEEGDELLEILLPPPLPLLLLLLSSLVLELLPASAALLELSPDDDDEEEELVGADEGDGEDASSELALASNDGSDVGASTGLGGTNRKLNATHVDGVFGKGVGEGERS